MLIASTGLRRGECLALAWDRVDLDAGVLRVTATMARVAGRLVISEPKTARARRTVPLSPTVVALLRKHRTEQKAERLLAGNQWQDSGLVFTTETGGPVDPRNLLRVVEAASKAAGVEGVGYIRFATRPRCRGWSVGCTSRRWPICSGTRRLRSPVMCTGTPPPTRRGPRWTGWPGGSGCERRRTASVS